VAEPNPFLQFVQPAQPAPTPQERENPFLQFVQPAQPAPAQPAAPVPQAPQAPALAPSWSEVPLQAASNIFPSAGHLIGGLYEAVTSPVQTIKSAGDILAGGLRAAMPERVRAFIDQADNPATTKRISEAASAAGGMLKDRYGSEEALRRTLATDPVGFAADASMLLTGGGTAAARTGAMAQRVGTAGGALARTGERVAQAGEAAAKVGQAVDPLSAAAKGAAAVGRGVGIGAAELVGGITGQGGKAVREAAESGVEGGARGAVFREQMRGGDAAAAVAEAKDALQNLRTQRQQEYLNNRQLWGNDQTVLGFKGVDKALTDATDLFLFKGVVKNEKAAEVFTDINKAVQEWKLLDPAEFHTAAGLDALKQKINGIVDKIPLEERTARAVGAQVYRSIWNEIQKQAPTYAKSMKAFEDASKQIEEITKTLSLNPTASVDTSLRKLQSIMRNNVNTNWGQREKLVQALERAGATDLMPMLAGQSSSSLLPRGLARLTPTLAAIGVGGLALGPTAIPALALTSPRIMGEAVHAGGRAVGNAQRLADALSRAPVVRNLPSFGQAARYGAAVQRYQNQEQNP
jgi:hypothetical protein